MYLDEKEDKIRHSLMVVKGLWIAQELQLSYQRLTDAETYYVTEGACNPQFTREDVVTSHVK